jgi:hypothetical protein
MRATAAGWATLEWNPAFYTLRPFVIHKKAIMERLVGGFKLPDSMTRQSFDKYWSISWQIK